jgi:hypothetical protein
VPCDLPLFFFFFFLCDLEDFFDLEREDFFLLELLTLCNEDDEERADEDERSEAMDEEADDVELDTDEIEETERSDVDDAEREPDDDELGEDERETRLFLLLVERLECSVRCLDFFLLFLFAFFSLLCLDFGRVFSSTVFTNSPLFKAISAFVTLSLFSSRFPFSTFSFSLLF